MGARHTRPGAMIASPVFVGSVLVLLVNDHVLKAAWPGFVTGKLSDVAGVSMIAILATALLRRPWLGIGLTAVAFAVLKVVPGVPVLAAPVLGGVTRTDPTDLLALAVLPAVWTWMHGTPRSLAGARGAGRRAGLAVLQVAAVTTAVFATTATSCDEDGVYDLHTDDAGVIHAIGAGVLSADGGRTWTDDPGAVDGRRRDDPSGPASAAGATFVLERSGSGYRLVERSSGVESVRFDADGAAVQRLDRLDPPACRTPPFQAITAVEVDGEPHAVVAMGWLGVIHAGPDGGAEWVAAGRYGVQEVDASSRPLGVDVATPIGTSGFGFAIPRGVLAIMLVATPLLPFAALAGAIALARRRRRPFDAAVWGCVVTGVLLGLAAGVVGVGFLVGGVGRTLTAVVLVVFAVSVAASAPWVLWHARASDPPDAGPPSGSQPLPPPDGRSRLG